ncbi:hypothetical protein BGHDH14_bgh05198 [Blumeria hordei DH14]|uniref:MARVEL domain-containing protein n=1 Tax=Blumeria graminis f. sp. hordei (strain DH14) TaxID=546991 RepID=N1JQX9_BLUG1|nr:hypothetical protein BGHDH14_bgh05198 [Blumeria hordei DH14]
MEFVVKYVNSIRIVQVLLSISIVGLLIYAANGWSYWWSPYSINFLTFTSIWSLLAIAILFFGPIMFPVAAHKYEVIAIEATTMLFWSAGSIALSSLLNNVGCLSSHWGPCMASVIAVTLSSIQWILFTVTTVLAVLDTRSNEAESPENV